MEIFAIVGLLTAYFKYRHAKANAPLAAEQEKPPVVPYVPKPLKPNATRLERIAYWLGLEDE